jgi:hypothetical protein
MPAMADSRDHERVPAGDPRDQLPDALALDPGPRARPYRKTLTIKIERVG